MTLRLTPKLTPHLTGKTRAVIDTLQPYTVSRVRMREHITGNVRTFHAHKNVHVRRVHPYACKVRVNTRVLPVRSRVRSGVRCKVRIVARVQLFFSTQQEKR